MVAPARRIVRPVLPRNLAAASASGASGNLQVAAERSLRDELDHEVNECRDDEREIN